MSTVGKICLVLTLLLLIVAIAPIPSPYGGWLPRLLVVHSEWSQKIRDAKEDVRKKLGEEAKARQELMQAAADLEALKIGWDKTWHIPARGPNVPPTAPSIANRNGQLILNNLGIQQGLVPRTITDANQAQQVVRPTIHAFYGGAEGETYIGEFVATDIGPTNAVLQPVHGVSPQEIASWPMNSAWRLRAMVPAAPRAKVDELNRHFRRTQELLMQTNANIQRQQEQLKLAQDALAVRRGELLGDPNKDPDDVPGRPEMALGLLKVTESVEEERDQLLLDIDRLRRAIIEASEQRDSLVEQLQKATEALPGSSTEYDRLPSKIAADVQ